MLFFGCSTTFVTRGWGSTWWPEVRGTLVLHSLTSPVEQTREVSADLPVDARAELAVPGWPSMSFIEHWMVDDPTSWWWALS